MTKGMYSNHFRACKWLLEIFKEKGKITFKTIDSLWRNNTDLSGGVEMLPRFFHRCKKSLRTDFGIDICCKNGGDYGYYIANPEILSNNNLPEWLLSTLATDEKLRHCMALMDYIIPEPIPSGEDRLDCVTNAMLVHKKLKYDYQKYESTERKPVELGVCGLIGSGEGYTDFVIEVRPNNELSSYIESRKNFLKVLSPDWYVEEIIRDLDETRKLYV